MKVELLISTMNERIYDVIEHHSSYKNENIIVTIIHQITDGKDYNIEHNKIRYFKMLESGLPKSRNFGLSKSIGEILIPTDDDVIFCDDFYETVTKAFKNNTTADIITFKIITNQGEPAFKNYRSDSFKHNFKTLMNVSSIEICAKRSSLLNNSVKWDDDFGLGSKFPGGLEVVFLQEARRKKLNMYFESSYIVNHPFESSGKVISEKMIILRSAVYFRSFGIIAPFLLIFFYVKKRSSFSLNKFDFFKYVNLSFKGYKDYKEWSSMR